MKTALRFLSTSVVSALIVVTGAVPALARVLEGSHNGPTTTGGVDSTSGATGLSGVWLAAMIAVGAALVIALVAFRFRASARRRVVGPAHP